MVWGDFLPGILPRHLQHLIHDLVTAGGFVPHALYVVVWVVASEQAVDLLVAPHREVHVEPLRKADGQLRMQPRTTVFPSLRF